VIRHPVSFQDATYYNVHRLLRAIDKNIILSKQDPKDLAGKNEMFCPPAQLFEAFRQHPSIITNTLKLMENCTVEIEFHRDKTKKIFSASKEDDRQLMRKLALDGLNQRYGSSNTGKKRVEKAYHRSDGFHCILSDHLDFIRYAQHRGFFSLGRGSGPTP
jgi:DNA polymerase-3 subunit alpha